MADTESLLFQAIRADPGDDTAWMALADHLEEDGQPSRAELTRLSLLLRRQIHLPHRAERLAHEARLRELLALGVRPALPTLSLSIGLELVLIPPGSFLMGSPEDEEQRSHDEGPVRRVTLTQGFYLGIYPVTQSQWKAIMKTNPSAFKGRLPRRPVETVSWSECQEFCRQLSEHENRLIRLPTEAEWEYSCRAGTSTAFHFGDLITTNLANFDGTQNYGTTGRGIYRRKTTLVGSFPANAFGLYDMHGNVWEWCQDWYQLGQDGRDQQDPHGLEDNATHGIRGGSWYVHPRRCRSAYRDSEGMSFRRDDCGCRVLVPLG